MNHRGFANLIIIIAAVVVLSVIASTYLVLKNQNRQSVPESRFCTMEAKQCPDGSYVGRTGWACEFARCPTVTMQCGTDSDCKLISNGCTCAAIPSSDSRTSLDSNGEICIWNDCFGPKVPVTAVCQQNKCVRSDKVQAVKPPPSSTTDNNSSCCTAAQQQLGYQCIENCGPPVVRNDDNTPPTYLCLSPADARSRQQYGCPICLSSQTSIATPQGKVNVRALKPGMLVWTLDKAGRRVTEPLITVSSVLVPTNHHVVHLVLKDGRELWVSPNHPTTSGSPVGELRVGDTYDGSVVAATIFVPYTDTKTYDLLPAGDTGFYWANGILMANSLSTSN